MNIKITKKYLVFPVSMDVSSKVLDFILDGASVYKLNIKLDNISPDFYAHIDVSRFINETLELLVEPNMKISCTQSDSMDIPNLYREKLRPQVHFSTKNGWINDPNGLLYMDGVYHMFYQHNPAAYYWDNMHWGHATSKDMIHWQEQDVAIFPSNNGHIFSGSAILDKKNLLGGAVDGEETAVMFYTATEPFSQRVVYSTDKFKTIKEYEGNPVIPNIVDANRDPKVVFCDEIDAYIMALYLTGNEYALLTSKNLTDWTVIQKIDFPEEGECPDIFFIRNKNGQKRWIIMGANDKYIVGEFKKGKFTALQKEMRLHYGTSAYAGQTFSNLPNERVVRVVWDKWHCRAEGFSGQMGIPMDMTLDEKDSVIYLCANPIEELKGIEAERKRVVNKQISPDTKTRFELQDKPYLIECKGQFEKGKEIDFSIFGCCFKVNFSDNELELQGNKMLLSKDESYFDMKVIVDSCSFEIFVDGGKAYMACVEPYTVCDKNLPWLEISSNKEYTLETLEICELESIWN